MMRATLFLSRKMVDKKPGPRFKGIARRLFIRMHRNVTDATEFFAHSSQSHRGARWAH